MMNHAFRLYAWRAAIKRARMRYTMQHGRKPRLFGPRRYTEKIQWRKLFDGDPIHTVLCDKFAVRDFIARRADDAVLVPLLWSGQPEGIPFDELRPPYVLKSNHAFSQVLMIREGDDIDRDAVRATAAGWLSSAFGIEQQEPGYVRIPRRLMVERMLLTPAGEAPTEWRFFTFDGRVEVIQRLVIENGVIRHGTFYRPDWTRLDWWFTRRLDIDFAPPLHLNEMVRVAEAVAAGFDHLRVDYYDCGNAFMIGELTLYPWSGLTPMNPDEADFKLGSYWRLARPRLRAAMAVLGQDVPSTAS